MSYEAEKEIIGIEEEEEEKEIAGQFSNGGGKEKRDDFSKWAGWGVGWGWGALFDFTSADGRFVFLFGRV